MFKNFIITIFILKLLLLVESLPTLSKSEPNNIIKNGESNGSKSIFIIGGHEVDIKDYPYQADVHMFGQHFCGGVIISNKAIVTAAHCVSAFHESILSVKVGSSKANSGGTVIEIESRHVHPNFNQLPADYDIAVLILTKALNFSEVIQPIGLQVLPVLPGALATVSGWGKTETNYTVENLRAVDIKIASEKKCFSKYEEAGYKMTDRMLCAGLWEGGHDACQGDSGGPLICKHNNKLCGIVSFGKGCGLNGYPGVYTKISKLRKWIMQWL